MFLVCFGCLFYLFYSPRNRHEVHLKDAPPSAVVGISTEFWYVIISLKIEQFSPGPRPFLLCAAISKPRVARSGNELPNARRVSATVLPDVDNPDFLHTLVLMVFGQFLDHDMSRTAISKIAFQGGEVFLTLRSCSLCCITYPLSYDVVIFIALITGNKTVRADG